MISQLTVFLENEEGRLCDACQTIADAGINMHALFLADSADFGIARIFCDTPLAARDALVNAKFRAAITPVLAVRVPNEKGGLAKLLTYLNDKEVNIEYGYCFSVNGTDAIDVLKIDNDAIETQLKAAGFNPVAPKEIYTVD